MKQSWNIAYNYLLIMIWLQLRYDRFESRLPEPEKITF